MKKSICIIFFFFLTLLNSEISEIFDTYFYPVSEDFPEYELVEKVEIDLKSYNQYEPKMREFKIIYEELPTESVRAQIGIYKLTDKNDDILWEKNYYSYGDFGTYITSESGITVYIYSTTDYNDSLIHWIDINGDTLNTIEEDMEGIKYYRYPIRNGEKWLLLRQSVSENINRLKASAILCNRNGIIETVMPMKYDKVEFISSNDELELIILSNEDYNYNSSGYCTYFISYNGEILHIIEDLYLSLGRHSHYAECNGIFIDSNSNIVNLSTYHVEQISDAIGTKEKTGLLLTSVGRFITVINLKNKCLLFIETYKHLPKNVIFTDDGSGFKFTVSDTLYRYVKKR